jgi:hypothetical protein
VSQQSTSDGHSFSGSSDGNGDRSERDVGYVGIIGLLCLIALWLLLMPWSREISLTSMRRFHLQTTHFLTWALQFPIPAMYNFANQAEVDSYPPGLVDPMLDDTEMRFLNHFPVRCITFADGRYKYLREGNDRWITVVTRYRGRALETRFHAKAKPKGRFDLIRLPDVESGK